jgi:hypothetical protein
MKKWLPFLLLILSVSAWAQHDMNNMPADKPSTHGMLLFGTTKIYASHLPMFHSPHNYQIILELELNKEIKKLFIKDQQLHPAFTTYTIEPEKFILPDMITRPRPFKVTIYRGHFERGGEKIAENITVTIKEVIYFKKFNAEESKATAADFILFGNNKEKFAVHYISNKPDFEQIIQIKSFIALFTGKSKYLSVRFNAKENSPAGISGNNVEVAAGDKKFNITLLKQIYLEFDDLKE